MILTAKTESEPEFAKMVINTCSLRVNGPGFKENDHPVPLILMGSVGRYLAMNLPSGRVIICAMMEEIWSLFCRYPKNWFEKARTTHEKKPSVHVRNVRAGMFGSSVVGTVNRTSSIGQSLFPSAPNYNLLIKSKLRCYNHIYVV